MSEVIYQWILERLGIVINVTPENFAETAKDGYLLAQLIRSYGCITQEQLEMVKRSTNVDDCFGNFKKLINEWLNEIGVHVQNVQIRKIVCAEDPDAAMALFYETYLLLKDRTEMSVILEKRLKERYRPKNEKFHVRTVSSTLLGDMPLPVNKLGNGVLESYDVVHWYRDRLEMIISKCKEARHEYEILMNSQETKMASIQSVPESKITKPDIAYENAESIDLDYQELMQEQRKAKDMAPFIPDPKEAKKILKKIKIKRGQFAENQIYKKELGRDIMTALWAQMKSEGDEDFNKTLAEKLLKQSLYEKQMLLKIGEVKLQKSVMVEDKRVVSDAIAKQKEAEFVEKLIQRDKELNEQEFAYYIEKERLYLLHRKIYEEKLRLKAKRQWEMCQKIVQDLTNVALKEVEYKEEFGEEPNRRIKDMWKKMFTAEQPLYDYVDRMEDIVKPLEEMPEDMEEIIHLEIERQNKIDVEEFKSYLYFDWPWELNSLENFGEDDLYEMECGLNILGNAVHRLLLTKYPYRRLPPKPDFPDFEITVCVNGLTDLSILPLLKKMLEERKILVAEMQDAINYCVQAYQQESKVEEEEEEEPKTKKKSKEPKPKKGEKPKSKKGTELASEVALGQERLEMVEKQVQTPKVYPCEEIPLSVKADLGKVADEQLSLGQPLTDYLLVAMFVEFLKSQKDIKGWVLINFPSSFPQAALLEEGLTGRPVPGMGDKLAYCKSILELAEVERCPEKKKQDKNEVLRNSYILRDPVVKEEKPFYNTALTAYVKVIQLGVSKETGETEFPPTPLELEETADELDKFYSDLGCNYSLFYRKFDFNTTKYLAKLVMGDFSIPAKTSVEIFGDSINYVNAAMGGLDPSGLDVRSGKRGEKVEKPKEKGFKIKEDATGGGTGPAAGKPGKAGKGKASSSRTKLIIVHVDKMTQIPEVPEESDESEEEPPPPPRPGEPGWRYVTAAFPPLLQRALAELWENAEQVYVEDFNQVLFLNRIITNSVMPFVNLVKEYMHVVITRPDGMQKYIRDFQIIYNKFDQDFRNDVEFKSELHCRVFEMREKLIELCDRMMMESEEVRCTLIQQSWAPREMTELINNYITAFQLEIDRAADSLTLLNDYYTAIVTQMPYEQIVDKEFLPKLHIEDPTVAQAIEQYLKVVDSDPEEIPLYKKVDIVCGQAVSFLDKTVNANNAIIDKVKALFSPKGGKGKDKPKKEKKEKGGDKSILTLFEPDQYAKDNQENIFDEWNCAVKGESRRAKVRLELLKKNLFTTLGEFMKEIQTTFYGVYNDIVDRYRLQIDSVNKACDLLGSAIEAEVPIQEQLIFKDGIFYVDAEHILFADELPRVEPIAEVKKEGIFTIEQLDRLTDILLDLAPSGYMSERAFVYMLQDMLINKLEPLMVPELWRKMTMDDVETLSAHLFDQLEYVQWKDFILYNLLVEFPTDTIIVDLRKRYVDVDVDNRELIPDYHFLSRKLWFEDMEEDKQRVQQIKQLLLKLYRVRNGYVNYSAMLLGFCKDVNPVVGFAKALSLSMGKLVCWDVLIGQKFCDEILRKRKSHEDEVDRREREMEENKLSAQAIIEQLIDKIVHFCDSVVLEDIDAPVDKQPPTEKDVSEPNIEEIFEDETQTMQLHQKYESDVSEEVSEEESGEDIMKFFVEANIEIAFEKTESPPLEYFLPLEVLTNVIATALPWHARVQNIDDLSFRQQAEKIYEECRNEFYNFAVLTHEYLANPKFINLLKKTTIFTAKNPVLIVQSILERKNENPNNH